MTLTVSEASRNYRQRKAEKAAQTAQTLDRYRGALEEIARLHITGFVGDIARQALTPTSHEMEGK